MQIYLHISQYILKKKKWNAVLLISPSSLNIPYVIDVPMCERMANMILATCASLYLCVYERYADCIVQE